MELQAGLLAMLWWRHRPPAARTRRRTDTTSHSPTNVGKAVAESIVVEFKNRQRAH